MSTMQACLQAPHEPIFWTLQGWWSHHSPGQPVPVAELPFQWRKYYIQSKPHATWGHSLLSCHLLRGRRDWPFSLHPPFRWLERTVRSPLSLLFSRLNTPAPSAAPHTPDSLPALLSFSGPSPAPQCLPCSEGPRTKHRIWGVASPMPSTEGQSLSWSYWPLYCWYRPGCHWPSLATWAHTGTFSSVSCPQHPQILSTGPFFSLCASLKLCKGLVWPKARTWHLTLLNLIKLALVHWSRSLCRAFPPFDRTTLPSSLVLQTCWECAWSSHSGHCCRETSFSFLKDIWRPWTNKSPWHTSK